MEERSKTKARKLEHLLLFKNRYIETQARKRTTLLECVELPHNAAPELSIDEISLETEFAGFKLSAPFMITGMTGGAEEAKEINLALARVAQKRGIAFGLGSQRAMIENPELTHTYNVREAAPQVFVAGNIGAVQAARYPVKKVEQALEAIGANALCVHLNPAQELAQPEGDRDFRGGFEGIEKLIKGIGVPVIVKETGGGISYETASRLRELGVKHIDVSGVGGTSWVGVELLRARSNPTALQELWDWGLPTALSVCEAAKAGAEVVASGGIRNSLDAARAISLGAKIAGFAAPILKAYYEEGEHGVDRFVRDMIEGLKAILLLCGCSSLDKLRNSPRVIKGELAERLNGLNLR